MRRNRRYLPLITWPICITYPSLSYRLRVLAGHADDSGEVTEDSGSTRRAALTFRPCLGRATVGMAGHDDESIDHPWRRPLRSDARRDQRQSREADVDVGRVDRPAQRHSRAALHRAQWYRRERPRRPGVQDGARARGPDREGRRRHHLCHALAGRELPGLRVLPCPQAPAAGGSGARHPQPVLGLHLRPLRRGCVGPRRRLQACPARRLGGSLHGARLLGPGAGRRGALRRRGGRCNRRAGHAPRPGNQGHPTPRRRIGGGRPVDGRRLPARTFPASRTRCSTTGGASPG